MLAFLHDHNNSQSVIDIFEHLHLELRPDRFMRLFSIRFWQGSVAMCKGFIPKQDFC